MVVELGVVDWFDIFYEGIEFSNIVDRIIFIFFLDVYLGKDNFVDNFKLECLVIVYVLILLKCDFMFLWLMCGGCKV